MTGGRVNGFELGGRRRWSFAGCVFDEANWALTVDGQRVVVETKPLELLRELLLNAGNLVSKDQLMDVVWPNVEVVEASLPTAIGKLRRALRDDQRDRPIIENVPRRGYRLAVPVEVEQLPDGAQPQVSAAAAPVGPVVRAGARRSTDRERPGLARGHEWLLGGGLALVSVLLVATLGTANTTSPKRAAAHTYTRADVFTALRRIDVEAMERMIAAGWDPNRSLDSDGNGALGSLLNNCEWDPGHDRRRMLLAARTLVEGGARVEDRNAWGDTSYSIAKAERYCGPDHPVTKMIHTICYEGGNPIGDRCLEHYKRDASGKVLRQKPQPAK